MLYQELIDYIQTLSESAQSQISAQDKGFSFQFPTLESEICCEIDKKNESISIYAPIGLVPEYEKEEYFQMLLEGHLFGTSTGYGSFAYEKESNKIYLFRNLLLKCCDAEQFKQALEDMLLAVEFWHEQVKYSSKAVEEDVQDFHEWIFYQRV